MLSIYKVLFLALALICSASPAQEEYPEVIPGPGLPSLASLGLESRDLFAMADHHRIIISTGGTFSLYPTTLCQLMSFSRGNCAVRTQMRALRRSLHQRQIRHRMLSLSGTAHDNTLSCHILSRGNAVVPMQRCIHKWAESYGRT